MVELVSFFFVEKMKIWHSYSYMNEFKRLQILYILFVCNVINVHHSKDIAYSKSFFYSKSSVFRWDDIRLEFSSSYAN